MKITNILNTDNDFLVTFTPNWFEKNILGKKEISKEYKLLRDKYYINCPNNSPVISKEGDIIPYTDEISQKINNYIRSW